MENTFHRVYSILCNVWGSGRVLIGKGVGRRYVFTPNGRKQTYSDSNNLEDQIISTLFGFVLMLFLKWQHNNITSAVFFHLLRKRAKAPSFNFDTTILKSSLFLCFLPNDTNNHSLTCSPFTIT